MALVGVGIMLFCSVLLCRAVVSYYDRVLSFYEEVLRLLYLLRRKIGSCALTLDQILDAGEGFDHLDRCGFLSAARERGLLIAFFECEKQFVIEDGDKELLRRYFSDFGSDMMSAELENLSLLIDEFEKKSKQIREEIPKKKKVSSAMIVCTTLMLVIMII